MPHRFERKSVAARTTRFLQGDKSAFLVSGHRAWERNFGRRSDGK